mmetsp:Transcript_19997/g.22340  ORF Transcript_19997/g.22340 Transcript_19997/m.22340 type:complete len:114 (-) Transcript_19997:535-876(-)
MNCCTHFHHLYIESCFQRVSHSSKDIHYYHSFALLNLYIILSTLETDFLQTCPATFIVIAVPFKAFKEKRLSKMVRILLLGKERYGFNLYIICLFLFPIIISVAVKYNILILA